MPAHVAPQRALIVDAAMVAAMNRASGLTWAHAENNGTHTFQAFCGMIVVRITPGIAEHHPLPTDFTMIVGGVATRRNFCGPLDAASKAPGIIRSVLTTSEVALQRAIRRIPKSGKFAGGGAG